MFHLYLFTFSHLTVDTHLYAVTVGGGKACQLNVTLACSEVCQADDLRCLIQAGQNTFSDDFHMQTHTEWVVNNTCGCRFWLRAVAGTIAQQHPCTTDSPWLWAKRSAPPSSAHSCSSFLNVPAPSSGSRVTSCCLPCPIDFLCMTWETNEWACKQIHLHIHTPGPALTCRAQQAFTGDTYIKY